MTHRRGCNPRRWLRAALVCALVWPWGAGTLWATEVLMKDGRLLRGNLGKTSGLADMNFLPDANSRKDTPIVFLDDNLRRTFVSQQQIQEVRADSQVQVPEKFRVRQPSKSTGARVATVGVFLRVRPFDEFGRRRITMDTVHGPLEFTQGITEITPEWTKVEGISPYVWDMRIATSSIPRDILHKVLMRQIKNPKDIGEYQKVANFFLQAERFEEAREELEAALRLFPDNTEVKARLEPTIRDLRQLSAKRVLRELKMRRDAGQHQLVLAMLRRFPADDVAGETLQAVRGMIQEYEALLARGKRAVQEIDALLAKVKDSDTRRALRPLRDEIAQDLSYDTLNRMATFLQNVNDPSVPTEDKLALAVSGWLLGPDAATTKLGTALSIARLRDMVRQYLNEPAKLNRVRIAHELPSEEAATPTMLAQMIAHMKPPYDLPAPVSKKMPGYYDLEVSILPREAPVHYLIQLPPDYNPYRRYPMIVTLHGASSTAENQINWWAGEWGRAGRTGQAGRIGYIVMAPEWAGEHQDTYRYTVREHTMVLGCYRDACRRFAVDTDRVFLSGHSMGGDAAWDMGLAHPDLWAGVIPIVAVADRFCAFYRRNAKNLPFYLVGGDLDDSRMSKNSTELDHYLRAGYNATVVEYQGRGHEHFSDENAAAGRLAGPLPSRFLPPRLRLRHDARRRLLFLVGGAGRHAVEDHGEPRGLAAAPRHPPHPSHRQNHRQQQPLDPCRGRGLTVWLAPGMFDFQHPISIVVNGRKMNNHSTNLAPNLETLLEDVRARGDRLHPFWAKFECSTGRLAE